MTGTGSIVPGSFIMVSGPLWTWLLAGVDDQRRATGMHGPSHRLRSGGKDRQFLVTVLSVLPPAPSVKDSAVLLLVGDRLTWTWLRELHDVTLILDGEADLDR